MNVFSLRLRFGTASCCVLSLGVLFVAPLVGCGGGGAKGGDSGSADGRGRDAQDAGPAFPVVKPMLSDIQAKVFTPTCTTTSCHGGLNHPLRMLDLRAGASYMALVSQASYWRPELMRVAPGNPAGSFLLEKLTRDMPMPVGVMRDNYINERMPNKCETFDPPACLPDQAIAAIRQWIMDGAKND